MTEKRPAAKVLSQNKLSFIIVKPRGGASVFFVSPRLLGCACLFALVFTAFSLLVINRHFGLYLDHKDLAAKYEETARNLRRLQYYQEYQAQLDRDYAEYLKSFSRAVEENARPPRPFEESRPAAPGEANTPQVALASPLDAWAESMPAPESEAGLDVEDFTVNEAKFRFTLVNRGDSLAQGRLLALFAVKYPGEAHLTLVPWGGFDPKADQADFKDGQAFSLRLNKRISGRLELPPGSEIIEAMIAAENKEGQIVLKKKARPQADD